MPPSVDGSALVFLPPATGKEKDEGEAQAHNACTGKSLLRASPHLQAIINKPQP